MTYAITNNKGEVYVGYILDSRSLIESSKKFLEEVVGVEGLSIVDYDKKPSRTVFCSICGEEADTYKKTNKLTVCECCSTLESCYEPDC